MEDEAYVINPDQSISIWTHWIALDVNDNNVTYTLKALELNTFQKKFKKFIGYKNYYNKYLYNTSL